MEEKTMRRLQQAHQRQRKEWDRVGRRLKRLTGKRSSDLLLHDPLLQPPYAADPGQRLWMRMSGGQQVAMPVDRRQATSPKRRNHPQKAFKFSASKDDLLVVGQRLQMHQPPGRRLVQLQGATPTGSCQSHQQMEQYVYFYPLNCCELESWSPPAPGEEPYLVVDPRFMAELLDELLLQAGFVEN
ncbi:uncharacterized protein LOC108028856 [Drosophila biarmipes]|uniref:uncharacterized protein LOC108028856 n=1 Tax=Drosophila biarmipes TaxID=125945 RepID=UPI0007E6AA57|nr:uncharacterized protein LOC108028856 [Drosophila biarmipes]